MLKRGLGATDEPTRPDAPTFERLEPRLLLSADPTGLAAQNSLDFLDDQTDAVAAIVIDFEPPTSDELLVVGEEGISEGESQEGESSQGELQSSALLVSSPSESACPERRRRDHR